MAAPSVFSVNLNDDEAERRKRRLKTNIGSLLSPGAHTPKFGQVGQSVRSANPDSGQSSLSNTQIAEHYANCIKLSSQNKISSKNAFGLHLIDHMLQLLTMRGEMTNFQVASSTLDASAKIYAGRVDSIYNDAFKVLGGLGREGTTANDKESDDSGVNPAEKKQKKTVSTGTAVTVEKNPKVLDVNTFDLEFEIDPLFRNTSAAFDDGGVDALLFSHLTVRDDSCLMEFVGSDSIHSTADQPTFINGTELLGIFNHAEAASRLLCPTFSDILFNNQHAVNSFDSDKGGLQIDEDLRLVPGADYSMLPCPPWSHDVNDVTHDIVDHYDDDNPVVEGDPEATVLGVFDDPGVAKFVPNSKNSEATIDEGPLCLMEAIEPSEYSYFAPAVLASWAGPLHWKINNKQNAHLKKEPQRVKKTRGHSQYKIDFETIPDVSLLDKSKASTKLGQSAKSKMTSFLTTLPRETHSTVATLHKLFCRPKLKVKRQKCFSNSNDFDGPWYDYENLNDNINYCPQLSEDDAHESYEDYEVANEVAHSVERTSNFFDNPVLGETIANADVPFSGMNLVALPHKVKPVPIDYARSAKRLDVKKLKAKMWEVITESSEDMKENMVDRVNSTIKSTKKNNSQFVDFHAMYSKLPSLLSAQMSSSISVPICFVCLLHLANEKSLQIHGKSDMTDAVIQANL